MGLLPRAFLVFTHPFHVPNSLLFLLLKYYSKFCIYLPLSSALSHLGIRCRGLCEIAFGNQKYFLIPILTPRSFSTYPLPFGKQGIDATKTNPINCPSSPLESHMTGNDLTYKFLGVRVLDGYSSKHRSTPTRTR